MALPKSFARLPGLFRKGRNSSRKEHPARGGDRGISAACTCMFGIRYTSGTRSKYYEVPRRARRLSKNSVRAYVVIPYVATRAHVVTLLPVTVCKRGYQ
eukprot:scaffold572_cov141-Pinguiococcus_pyrenoidosus.AAC.1